MPIVPWPHERPTTPPSGFGWMTSDVRSGLSALVPRDARVLLEIGSHFGLSARLLAGLAPSATVYCVDPWEPWRLAEESALPTFIASCWELRDRIVPVKGRSPDELLGLYALGVYPDLVYIDGDHAREGCYADLDAVTRLWPRATVCGDDHDPDHAGVIAAVSAFCMDRGREKVVSGRFWMLA